MEQIDPQNTLKSIRKPIKTQNPENINFRISNIKIHKIKPG